MLLFNYKKIVVILMVSIACNMFFTGVVGQEDQANAQEEAAATPKPVQQSTRNLLKTWINLSLSGYNQSQIESAFSEVDKRQLEIIKHRLRTNIINNLENSNLTKEIQASRLPQDLVFVRDKILTEIYFAGLENDFRIRQMIRQRYGIF